MMDINTETVVWLISSNNTLTSRWDGDSTTTTTTTTTTTSWYETSGRDDGTKMIERDVATEDKDKELDKTSSSTIIAPNDTETLKTMTTAATTTATSYISTTTTAASTTISTTDVEFLSEHLISDDDDDGTDDGSDEGRENDEEKREDDDEESEDDAEESEDDEDDDISELNDNASYKSKHSTKIKCPSIPPNLVGRLKVNLTAPSWKELETTPGFSRLGQGGEFYPENCDPEYLGKLAKLPLCFYKIRILQLQSLCHSETGMNN